MWRGEVCKRCHRRNVIGFNVSDGVWATVAGDFNILCPTCFDELAEEKGVEYQFDAVYPVSWSMWEEIGNEKMD
jgi:hypothetical protein